MRPTPLTALAGLVLIALAAPSPCAAEEPLAGAGLESEVRKLNTTLGELVELLRRQLTSTNAAVLMQRVQLMTSRMAPLEAELRRARDDLDGREAELDELEMSLATFESQVERDLELENVDAQQARIMLDQQRVIFDQRKKQVEERLWAIRQRVIDLEQELSKRRTEIETWEGEIDRSLGLR